MGMRRCTTSGKGGRAGREQAWPDRGEREPRLEVTSTTRGKASGRSSPVSTEQWTSLGIGMKVSGRGERSRARSAHTEFLLLFDFL